MKTCTSIWSQLPTNITLTSPPMKETMFKMIRETIGTRNILDVWKSNLPILYSSTCSASSTLLVGKKLASLIPILFIIASKLPYKRDVIDFIIHILCSFLHIWNDPPVERTSCKCLEMDDKNMNKNRTK